MSGLQLPDGRIMPNPKLSQNPDGTIRVGQLMTPDEWRRLERVTNSRFNLFRNNGGDYGERPICRRRNPDGTISGCGAKHMYFTYMCIERPYRGLEEGLWYAMRATRSEVRRSQIMDAITHLPDIATGHPLMAGRLEPDAKGEAWYGVLLSLPEPIDPKDALRFQRAINDARPPIPFALITPQEEVLIDAGVALDGASI